MFDLGTQELIVIFVVAFLVFGPKKLPELGRTLGKGIRELKTAMRGVKDSLEESGAADITDEIKTAKSNVEESIYKSIESHISEKEEEKEVKEKTETETETGAGRDLNGTTGEKDKERKETDKDG